MNLIMQIARYEFIIQWRQRVSTVGSVIAIIIFGFVIVIISNFFRQQVVTLSVSMRETSATILLINLHVQIFIFFIAVLPILTADTIARDKDFGITDIMNSMPVTKTAYLIGKVLSAMMSSSIIVISLNGLVGTLWWILVHQFNVGVLISQVWLPLFLIALIQPALVLLVVSGVNSRRAAVIASVVLAAIVIFVAAGSAYGTGITIVDYFNIGRPVIMKFLAQPGEGPIALSAVWITIVVAALQLVAVFSVALILRSRAFRGNVR